MPISRHESTTAKTHVWMTPLWIVEALGPFDLDPAAPDGKPDRCAKRGFTELEDGLSKPWEGFVWLNPPYGRFVGKWIERLRQHRNGICLIFGRTDTKWFQESCGEADAILLIKGRIRFLSVETGLEADRVRNGKSQGGNSSGAPSILVGFGPEAKKRLEETSIEGILVYPKAKK